MNLVLMVWRQERQQAEGRLQRIEAKDISPEMSFLEMLDVVNERLTLTGERPIAFDHDCREGICGSCGVVINGIPHGPRPGTTTCQLHMRQFHDGQTIVIEPYRARPFPVLRDLIVDRSALDRIMAAGGFISASTGAAPDGNAIQVSKSKADAAMDAAACIGCGACIAACPNASAMLFAGAKISHLGLLPQGQPERWTRAENMVAALKRGMVAIFRSIAARRKCHVSEYLENARTHRADHQWPIFDRRRCDEDIAHIHVPVADEALAFKHHDDSPAVVPVHGPDLVWRKADVGEPEHEVILLGAEHNALAPGLPARNINARFAVWSSESSRVKAAQAYAGRQRFDMKMLCRNQGSYGRSH